MKDQNPRHDVVTRPAHYNSSPAKCSECGHPIECIDVAKHMNFQQGSAFKYLWRAGLKGAALEDLKKAAQYLDFEIRMLEGRPKRGL